MGVGSLGQEDPLQEGMATHSNILAWRIPQTEEPGGLQSMELQRVSTTVVTQQSHTLGWMTSNNKLNERQHILHRFFTGNVSKSRFNQKETGVCQEVGRGKWIMISCKWTKWILLERRNCPNTN